MGIKDGSIIATIITTHMPRNDAAAPGHVCPGVRIHAIDIVQPPGIGISPIADMDAHQTIVRAALAAKSSAETPKNACWGARWEVMCRKISSLAVVQGRPRRRSAPPVPQLRQDDRYAAQPLLYSSWRRHQIPFSLR